MHVYIKDGKIHEIGRFEKPESCEIIDCTGKVITHGFLIYMYTFGNQEEKTKKL